MVTDMAKVGGQGLRVFLGVVGGDGVDDEGATQGVALDVLSEVVVHEVLRSRHRVGGVAGRLEYK